jgi:hypothetical protein
MFRPFFFLLSQILTSVAAACGALIDDGDPYGLERIIGDRGNA